MGSMSGNEQNMPKGRRLGFRCHQHGIKCWLKFLSDAIHDLGLARLLPPVIAQIFVCGVEAFRPDEEHSLGRVCDSGSALQGLLSDEWRDRSRDSAAAVAYRFRCSLRDGGVVGSLRSGHLCRVFSCKISGLTGTSVSTSLSTWHEQSCRVQQLDTPSTTTGLHEPMATTAAGRRLRASARRTRRAGTRRCGAIGRTTCRRRPRRTRTTSPHALAGGWARRRGWTTSCSVVGAGEEHEVLGPRMERDCCEHTPVTTLRS